MYIRKTNPILQDKRNREILEKRLSGRKLEDIAGDYGVTRERIRQVIKFTLSRLSESERARADGLMAINLRGGIERHLYVRRQDISRQLRDLFRVEFDRDKIFQITEMNRFNGTDIELCSYLHAKYQIKNFFKWRRCWRCKEIKELRQDGPGLCTACNTIRHNETIARNPHLIERQRIAQRAKPNHMKLYELRCLLRKAGRLSEMPPLPPKGTPDCKIKVPRVSFRKSETLSGSNYRRDNRAKKLVIQEARSRGIDAEL